MSSERPLIRPSGEGADPKRLQDFTFLVMDLLVLGC